MVNVFILFATQYRPCPPVSGYFLIRNFFFLDSKIFPSTRSEFAPRIRWYPDSLKGILVPRGPATLGQHQESRPLAGCNQGEGCNTGKPRFTDFSSLCACSESSLTNLIGSGLILCSLFAEPITTGISLDLSRGRDS